ncbi:MAG TPA: hypothetical protein ENO22_11880 [candidate division Zixibacteria bacterium]|mgnify:CR=1 FL=1|nr:hypothetical protein [candidate division Zixibacteria bacterium]HER00029.1 hypothetical protein [candidate division Zixibacteria bacterium]
MERFKKIVKFSAGCVVLGLILLAAASGNIPTGGEGGVIEHNLREKRDATPLIYSESEEMPRLEQGLSEIKLR